MFSNLFWVKLYHPFMLYNIIEIFSSLVYNVCYEFSLSGVSGRKRLPVGTNYVVISVVSRTDFGQFTVS